MAHTPPLARRLRLGIIGDGAGAGAIDADQLGAASAFRAVDGDVTRQLPAFGAGAASAAALAQLLGTHDHLLLFDAQIPGADAQRPEVLAEALSWLLNQGVDLVAFCHGCDTPDHALNAALDRSHRFGVTLIAGVTAPWPSTHPAVIGVAAQVDADAGLQWLGGDACSVLHGGTGDPAVAVGDVANVLLSGIATGLVRHDLLTHLQQHCGSTAQRRAG